MISRRLVLQTLAAGAATVLAGCRVGYRGGCRRVSLVATDDPGEYRFETTYSAAVGEENFEEARSASCGFGLESQPVIVNVRRPTAPSGG